MLYPVEFIADNCTPTENNPNPYFVIKQEFRIEDRVCYKQQSGFKYVETFNAENESRYQTIDGVQWYFTHSIEQLNSLRQTTQLLFDQLNK